MSFWCRSRKRARPKICRRECRFSANESRGLEACIVFYTSLSTLQACNEIEPFQVNESAMCQLLSIEVRALSSHIAVHPTRRASVVEQSGDWWSASFLCPRISILFPLSANSRAEFTLCCTSRNPRPSEPTSPTGQMCDMSATCCESCLVLN